MRFADRIAEAVAGTVLFVIGITLLFSLTFALEKLCGACGLSDSAARAVEVVL